MVIPFKLPQTADTYEEKLTKYDEACSMLFNWKDCVMENRKEYTERIRKVKLLRIMKRIMENELSSKQQDIIRLNVCRGKTYSEIAGMYGTGISTIARLEKRAEAILRENMKYVLEYADLFSEEEVTPVDVARAKAVAVYCASRPDKLGERVKKVRQEQFLSVQKAAAGAGLTSKRLAEIESCGKCSSDELIKLVTFLSVSADYLIMGIE